MIHILDTITALTITPLIRYELATIIGIIIGFLVTLRKGKL